jgi:hypothetical protein
MSYSYKCNYGGVQFYKSDIANEEWRGIYELFFAFSTVFELLCCFSSAVFCLLDDFHVLGRCCNVSNQEASFCIINISF